MKRGSVGTSNDSRSALPAQFRKGLLMFLSSETAFCAAATCTAASLVSGLPLSFFRASLSSASALAILLRRELLLELCLRPHFRPHGALSFGVLVVLGGYSVES